MEPAQRAESRAARKEIVRRVAAVVGWDLVLVREGEGEGVRERVKVEEAVVGVVGEGWRRRGVDSLL
jgi:hypothetical protein